MQSLLLQICLRKGLSPLLVKSYSKFSKYLMISKIFFLINVNNLSKPGFYCLVIILYCSFTKYSKSFIVISVHLWKFFSSIFLWKKFQICLRQRQSLKKNLELKGLMHPLQFAFPDHHCWKYQRVVSQEVYTTCWCHILVPVSYV